MFIIALANLIYGIVAGVSHEGLYMGLAIMIAGLSVDIRIGE